MIPKNVSVMREETVPNKTFVMEEIEEENAKESSPKKHRKYCDVESKTDKRLAPAVKDFNAPSPNGALVDCPNLYDFFISLVQNEDFNHCVGLHDQVIYSMKYATHIYDEYKRECMATDVSKFLGLTVGAISGHINRHLNYGGPKIFGRRPLIDVEQQNLMLKFVKISEKVHPTPILEALEIFNPIFHRKFSHHQMRHIAKSINGIKFEKCTTFEAERLTINKQDYYRYIAHVFAILAKGIPPQLLLNMDETGICDKADFKDQKKALVTEGNSNPMTPVSNAPRGFTHVGAVSASGEVLPSMLITKRSTCDNLIWGRVNLTNVLLAQQKSAFITLDLFLEWLKQILLPYVNKQRSALGDTHHNQWASYIRKPELMISLLGGVKTEENFLKYVTTLWSNKKNVLADFGLTEQSKQIESILSSYHKATTNSNVISSFKQAGYVWRLDQNGKWVIRFRISESRLFKKELPDLALKEQAENNQ
ncbi:DDE-1 domain-containing protein [Entamoeba marina]